MITEERKEVYLKDKIVNILLTDKETRCYTEAIIAASLNIPIEVVKDNLELMSPRINENIHNQYSMVDALYENNTSIINIEVNYRNTLDGRKRGVKYVCNLILRQIRINDKKLKLKPVYQININNYDIFNAGKFIYKSYLMEEELHEKRDNSISIIDINMAILSKMNYTDIKKGNKESLEWLLYALVCKNNRELDELYIGDEVMEKVRNKILDLTEEEWKDFYYNPDEELEAIKEEARKEGLEEGRKQGHNEGIEEGILEGKRRNTLEIAKSMLNKNMSIEDISDITGLTLEEVNELKNN